MKPDDVNESDITLYKNIYKAYAMINKMNIRSAADIRKIHKVIYDGVYDFAGIFRKRHATFGATEDAITSNPHSIRHDMLRAITKYRRDKKSFYPFERILRFHVDYQSVHPFPDGNSRLGRLLVVKDMLASGYPPPVLKKNNSHTYRSSLVRAINKRSYTSLFKLYYTAYRHTWDRFFRPLLEEKIKQSKIFEGLIGGKVVRA